MSQEHAKNAGRLILIRTENFSVSVSLLRAPARDGNSSEKIYKVVSLLMANGGS